MENPATWGKAEKVVFAALHEAEIARLKGVYGLSTTRQITDALRKAGLLREEEEK